METAQPTIEEINQSPIALSDTEKKTQDFVQPKIDIIPDIETRIEILRNAKANTLDIPVKMYTERGEEQYTVQMCVVDYRTEEQKAKDLLSDSVSSPIGIYLPGFGQYDRTSFDALDEHFAKHAESQTDGYGRMIHLAMKDIPLPQPTTQGIPESFTFDSQILLKSMQEFTNHPELFEATNLDYEFSKRNNSAPLRVYSYSQGSGIAISFVNRLIEQQAKANGNTENPQNAPDPLTRGKNNMTQFSVMGLSKLSRNTETFMSTILMTLKETINIGVSKIPILNQFVYYLYRGYFDKDYKRGFNLNESLYSLKQASNVARHLLFQPKGENVTQKINTLQNQLLKNIRENSERTWINSDWNVFLRIPENDLLYDKKALASSLAEEANVPFTARTTLEMDQQIDKLVSNHSFPNANSVDFRYIKGIDATHQGPSILPELYLDN